MVTKDGNKTSLHDLGALSFNLMSLVHPGQTEKHNGNQEAFQGGSSKVTAE